MAIKNKVVKKKKKREKIVTDETNGPGQPKKFTIEEIKEKIDCYFNENYPSDYTITGLCLGLGFYSRAQLSEYIQYDGYSDILKTAKLKVENCYEKKLSGQYVTGPIFVLKNMGWKEQQEIKNTGIIGIKHSMFEDL